MGFAAKAVDGCLQELVLDLVPEIRIIKSDQIDLSGGKFHGYRLNIIIRCLSAVEDNVEHSITFIARKNKKLAVRRKHKAGCKGTLCDAFHRCYRGNLKQFKTRIYNTAAQRIVVSCTSGRRCYAYAVTAESFNEGFVDRNV